MDLTDRELLARTLQAEAGNQGLPGLLAAGSVILNRANSPDYGDGLRGAILAPGQFSAWNSVTGYAGGEQGQNMSTMQPGQDAYATADRLLSGNYQDPTGGATHYYNPSISNPAWGRDRAGGDWLQIGDHIFGSADASTRGAPQMAMQPTQPQGLLGQLGIQRQDPTAQGETALPFYQRSRFGNTMGNLAMAFNSLRQRPDENIPRIVTGQRAAREQDAANNRTVEWLNSQQGGERFAGLVDSVGAAAALQAYQQSQAQPDQTTGIQNYEYLVARGMDPAQAIERSFGGGGVTVNTGDQIGDYLYGSDAGLPAGYRLNVATGQAEVIPGGPAEADLLAIEDAGGARDAGEAGSGVIVLDDINEMTRLIQESPTLTTGFFGSLLQGIGGTKALDVASLGETIRANIGFDRLQRMRDESPTGGALGQVAVQELIALQSTLGNLETSQSAPLVIRNLERLEAQYRRSMLRILNTENGESYFSPAEVSQLRGDPTAPSPDGATHFYNPETGTVEPL